MRHLAALALLAVEATAAGQPAPDPAAKTVIMPTDPRALQFQEEWGFADAVIGGDTVYLSGVVVGLRPGETELQPAFDRAFKRIGTILHRAGASWDDVLDITSFHTDVTGQLPVMVEVKKRYMKGPPPAWTAIQVSRLLPDAGITEIKIVARRPSRK
jgi:enamine deaminase RidA (YjgF/YER057c/UK114 family)